MQISVSGQICTFNKAVCVCQFCGSSEKRQRLKVSRSAHAEIGTPTIMYAGMYVSDIVCFVCFACSSLLGVEN